MQNLYTISTKREPQNESLTDGEKFSVFYHDIFDFPLSFSELIKWQIGETPQVIKGGLEVSSSGGYYFLEGNNGIVYKRMLRKRISAKKLEIAKKAAKKIAIFPWIKLVAVTGSLAMENCTDESDIDLMIITKRGTLWTSRLFSYLINWLTGMEVRKPSDRTQKDKLCLNLWLDESDLEWSKKDRNIYTAHEIGQIRPLINKDKTYEEFVSKNKWILKHWPNAVKIRNLSLAPKNSNFKAGLVEKMAYTLQRVYMKSKITREVVTPTRAIFHPLDWGQVVMGRLSS
jgi:predicted nucleotidyltransferase